MIGISDKTKSIASLAVFRDLYLSKQDVLEVIAEFVKVIISAHHLAKFRVNEVSQYVSDEFGFKIIDAIIKTVLRNRLHITCVNGLYTVADVVAFEVPTFSTRIQTANSECDTIVDELINYIKKKKGINFSDIDKKQIESEFCSYIVDDTVPNVYGEYISAFIILHEKEKQFSQTLNNIREGMIGILGLSYNANGGQIDKFSDVLEVYLDTEILFHGMGYNGDLFKRQFDEFFELVQEVNRKSQTKGNGKIIRLRYFQEIKKEIEEFFNEAETYIEKGKLCKPSRTAMVSIIKDCRSTIDLLEKKRQFEKFLQSKQIIEDSQDDYYNKSNYQLTIDYNEFLDENMSEWEQDRTNESLTFLNYIHIKRYGRIQTVLSHSKAIFLTGTSTCLKIAHDSKMIRPNEVPLAVGMTFLTCRLWMSLNKGLQLLSDLVSLNIVNKAQIILSSKCSEKVSRQFDELMKERETHDGNDENFVTLVKEKLIYLRDNLKKPEEIVSEAETDAMLDYLTETGLEEFAARKAAEEHRQKGIIENQRKEITQKTKEIANKDSILRKTLEQLRKQEQAKKDEIYSKQKMKYKEDCQLCVGRQITKLWVKYVGIVMFYFASLAFLTYFAWSKETKSIIVTFIVILLPYILKFITLDTLKQTFYFLTSFGYRKIQRKRIVREYILRKSPPTRCTVKNKDIMNIIK